MDGLADPEGATARRRQRMPDRSFSQADPERRQYLKMKVRRYGLIAAILALVLAVWGIGSRILARSELQKSTARAAVLTVVTTKPQPGGAGQDLVLPGIVQAYIESPIYARTNGYLKTWYTDIGARVHKGSDTRGNRHPGSRPGIGSGARRSRGRAG